MFKPQDCINLARYITNDGDSVGLRQSDPELLTYFNDGLKESVELAEHLFINTGDFTCVTNKTEQAITFAEARKLLNVLRIKFGVAVHEMDLSALAAFNPNWSNDAMGPAQNWFKFQGDPLRFYLYPKAPEMQVLEVTYVRNAGVYALNDNVTEVPDGIKPAIADYIIYRAESKDDEHSVSGRAVAHYQSFVQKLTGLQNNEAQ
jgi:hypothetical protein